MIKTPRTLLGIFLLPLFLCTSLMASTPIDKNNARLAQLDTYWAEVSRSVREGDFEGYKATCHPQAVIVSISKKNSTPLTVALARWEKEFSDTKSGKIKATVTFRFSQRLGDETTAHETGIFFYSTINTKGERTQEYLRFETLLVKREGGWKTLMEYQKTQATQQEWDALPK